MPPVQRWGIQKPSRTRKAIYHDFGVEQSIWRGEMAVHKRTEITIETDRVLIIRRRRILRAWCEECGHEVEMVDPREAEAIAAVRGLPLRDCAQWHVAQSHEGTGLICLDSLLKPV